MNRRTRGPMAEVFSSPVSWLRGYREFERLVSISFAVRELGLGLSLSLPEGRSLASSLREVGGLGLRAHEAGLVCSMRQPARAAAGCSHRTPDDHTLHHDILLESNQYASGKSQSECSPAFPVWLLAAEGSALSAPDCAKASSTMGFSLLNPEP